MNTPDLSQLQQEVIRLNKIISVLLEQIDTLKFNYSRLEKQMITNQPVYSRSREHIGTNRPADGNIEQRIVTNERLHSNMQQQHGTSERLHSNMEQPTGMNERVYSNTQQHLPVSEEFYPNTQQHLPVSKEFYSDMQKDLTESKEIYPEMLQQDELKLPLYADPDKSFPSGEPVYQLPQTIMVSQQNIGLLWEKLGASILKRSRSSAQQGAAKLLIHFYNKGTGSYDALRKLTGYSEGGLAKLMMLVRSKGLIRRSAFQQFAPSQLALQLMQEAKLK